MVGVSVVFQCLEIMALSAVRKCCNILLLNLDSVPGTIESKVILGSLGMITCI